MPGPLIGKNTVFILRSTLREKCPYSELFWSVFSRIRTEYGEMLRISPYSVRMRKNTDQNNSEYGHFCAVQILKYHSAEIWFLLHHYIAILVRSTSMFFWKRRFCECLTLWVTRFRITSSRTATFAVTSRTSWKAIIGASGWITGLRCWRILAFIWRGCLYNYWCCTKIDFNHWIKKRSREPCQTSQLELLWK